MINNFLSMKLVINKLFSW